MPLPKTVAEMEVVFRQAETAGDLLALEPMLTAFIRKRIKKSTVRTKNHHTQTPWSDEAESRTVDRLIAAVEMARALEPTSAAKDIWESVDLYGNVV
jgi:hypothetical protein